MSSAPPTLTLGATKPAGPVAALLRGQAIQVVPVEEDEGPVEWYIASQRLAIERRTGSTFLRGIVDKSLFTSAIYLAERFAIPVLILEGQIDLEYTSFHPQAVRGALSALVVGYGMRVLPSPTVKETASLIAMMARQEQVGIPQISLVPKRRAVGLADLQRRVVEMLPGCGRVLARELLQHFGSIHRIACAGEQELDRIHGVGRRRARELHRVLTAEYESLDTERDLEDAIEAAPDLLFAQPVRRVARQHGFPSETGARDVVDLVFLDPAANELIVVELKRGQLAEEHRDQLRRYLDRAPCSPFLRGFLEKGARLRGVLATCEPGGFEAQDADIATGVIDRQRAIQVLRQLRARRLAAAQASTEGR